MKATLHDELMREAGFQTDYYTELGRRRKERRERVRSARRRIWTAWYRVLLVLCLGVAAADFFGLVHYVPKGVAAGASVVALVVLRADEFGLRSLLRWIGLIPPEEDRRESRIGAGIRSLGRRLRHRPEVGD
jgi:hypothetical protein